MQMMTAIRTYAQQGKYRLRRIFMNPRIRGAVHIAHYLLRGFVLSAASLGQYCQPFAMSLICAGSGWSTALSALGAGIGYWLFWGKAGLKGSFGWQPGYRQHFFSAPAPPCGQHRCFCLPLPD